MDEHFEFDRGLAADLTNLGYRQLASQHDALDAQLGGRLNALAAGERHLRRGVNGKLGTHRADESREAQVLDEHGVDACLGEPHDVFFNCW